jgi:hypothetical protein
MQSALRAELGRSNQEGAEVKLTEEQYQAIVRRQQRPGSAVPAAPKKRSKYGNKPTVVCGEQFDSGKEARRYEELLLLERTGKISQLRHHVRYPLEVNGIAICEYELDFEYVDDAGLRHYEDVKTDATRTQLFKVKQRLMAAVHSINVQEVL